MTNDLAGMQTLIQRSQAGDALAFSGLVELLTPRLYRIIRRVATDDDLAADIVQETWLKAWRGWERYDARRPLMPWLASIALNTARDRWRRGRWLDPGDWPDSGEEPADQRPGLEEQVIEGDQLARLARAVDRLRPVYRAVIALRYDGGMDYLEIARTMDIPLNTVRTHLRRAKQALARELEAMDE
jgi:RNA polymerase sigma-70 factor, ECF subfamily